VLTLHQRLARSDGGAAEREALLARVGLRGEGGRKVETMSKGMQQRLGIAQALVGDPRLVLLDEPTSALDPGGRRTVRDLLVGLREQGIGVLLNSHLLSEIELVCDRVVIIDGGRVVTEGRPRDLTAAGGVEIETSEGVRRLPDARRQDVPRIVRELVAAGTEVYGVRVVTGTLEDAYLAAVVGRDG
jgi:ABC-2 type transport system ATP-binding protein